MFVLAATCGGCRAPAGGADCGAGWTGRLYTVPGEQVLELLLWAERAQVCDEERGIRVVALDSSSCGWMLAGGAVACSSGRATADGATEHGADSGQVGVRGWRQRPVGKHRSGVRSHGQRVVHLQMWQVDSRASANHRAHSRMGLHRVYTKAVQHTSTESRQNFCPREKVAELQAEVQGRDGNGCLESLHNGTNGLTSVLVYLDLTSDLCQFDRVIPEVLS